MVMFVVIGFSSYNIQLQDLTIIYSDSSLFFFNIGMGVLSFILLLWDLWDKFTTGDF